MKGKLIYIATVFILIPWLAVSADWEIKKVFEKNTLNFEVLVLNDITITPTPEGKLWAVGRGIVEGQAGFVSVALVSADGGENWEYIPEQKLGVPPTTLNNIPLRSLDSVSFPTSTVGYIVGHHQLEQWEHFLLVTHDGGKLWVYKKLNLNPQLPSPALLHKLHFFSPEVGVLAGDKTINLVEQTGAITKNAYSFLLSSSNGGDKWDILSPKGQLDPHFDGLVRTSKDGNTWAIVRDVFVSQAGEGATVLQSRANPETMTLFRPHHVSLINKCGWVVGEFFTGPMLQARNDKNIAVQSRAAAALRTINSGHDWQLQILPGTWSNSIYQVNEHEAIVVGATTTESGKEEIGEVVVAHTVDGGRTWVNIFHPTGTTVPGEPVAICGSNREKISFWFVTSKGGIYRGQKIRDTDGASQEKETLGLLK